MTEAEAVWTLMDAFPGVKVESCLASTKHEVMMLAIRRQNERRGPERPIGGGEVGSSACRQSELRSPHGAAPNPSEARKASEAEDGDGPFDLWSQAV